MSSCAVQVKKESFELRWHVVKSGSGQPVEKHPSRQKHFRVHIAGRDAGCSLRFTKGTSRSFSVCLLLFHLC